MESKEAAVLSGHSRAAAGARCIVKRAYRKTCPESAARAKDMSPEALAAWAADNPGPVLAACVRNMERAADAWVEGNNSGDAGRLRECERECDRLREDAELCLALYGITCDYPGLYPTYMKDGRTEYEGGSIGRLIGGDK